jgi:hypothetical protein
MYQKYRNWLQLDNTYKWQSQIFIPEFFTIVWTVLPAFMEAMFSQTPYISIEPKRQDTVEGSRYAEGLLQAQLERIGDDERGIFMFALGMALDNFIYGNAFYDVHWRFEEALRKKRIPTWNTKPVEIPAISKATGVKFMVPPGMRFMGYRDTESLETIYDDPDLTLLDWKQVYPDPFSKTVQAPARFIITRQTMSPYEIERLRGREGYKKN